MSELSFGPSEVRLATFILTAVAALIPLVYILTPSHDSELNEHNKTFNSYIKSYSTLRAQALTSTLSRDFSHTSLPASLNIATRTMQPFTSHAENLFSSFSGFGVIPLSNVSGDAIHFSPSTSTVVAHCKMGGILDVNSEMARQSGLTEWWTEGVLFVKMSRDGKRIVEIREFLHSSKAEEMETQFGA